MNTKANQLYQNVEKRIETVFQRLLEEESLENVTVSEICRRANIHRTTFYGHYQDVYALMEHTVSEMYQTVVDGFHSSGDQWVKGGLLALFIYIREHRAFFRSYMALSRQRGGSASLLPQKLEEHIHRLAQQLGQEDETVVAYRYQFFSEGLKGVLSRWIDGGCAQSPQWMAALLSREFDCFILPS